MQRLYPLPAEQVSAPEAAAWPREPRGERPWVMLNMVASIDGAATVGGLSAGLSEAADRTLFWALRSEAGAVLVGARTANAERYRRDSRSGARIAVVSGTLGVEADLPLFAEAAGEGPGDLPIVFTAERADSPKAALLSERAEVLRLGETEVDLAAALAELRKRGADVVLCEGGPALNASLLALDLVDEINLTISPQVVGSDSVRIVAGAAQGAEMAKRFELGQVLSAQGALFVRWQRAAR